MFTFLPTADIHPDSPLRGLERYEGAPADQISPATRRAVDGHVDECFQARDSRPLARGEVPQQARRRFPEALHPFPGPP